MKKIKLKNGFTMLELIMVIIVMGILAASAMTQFRLTIREDLINNIVMSLRYTQHLAMTDNKMNPANNLWIRSLWTFKHEKCNGKWQYTIASDMNLDGDFQSSEAATSTIDKKLLFTDTSNCESTSYSEDIAIGKKLSVSNISFSNCGSSNAISFDYLGRPHIDTESITNSDYNSLLKNNCIITYTFDGSVDPVSITINKDTGYISVNNRGRL